MWPMESSIHMIHLLTSQPAPLDSALHQLSNPSERSKKESLSPKLCLVKVGPFLPEICWPPWTKWHVSLASPHLLMLRLFHMLTNLPCHLPEVKWVEKVAPPKNGSKSPQAYSIWELERHPWTSVPIAHKLFISRCCDHFQMIAHLPISLIAKSQAFLTLQAKVMSFLLKSPQARLCSFSATLNFHQTCPIMTIWDKSPYSKVLFRPNSLET
jgi:hypothetical protein